MPHPLVGLFSLGPQAPALPVPFPGSAVGSAPTAEGPVLSNHPVPDASAMVGSCIDLPRLVAGLVPGRTAASASASGWAATLRTVSNAPMTRAFALAVPVDPIDVIDEIPVVEVVLALWRMAVANPRQGFDAYANGGFKLTHPPSVPMASVAEDARQAVGLRLLERLAAIPADAVGGIGMLAAIRASAQRPDGLGWPAFQPQAAAIARLSDRADVARHFCEGMTDARPSVLSLDTLFGEAIIGAENSVDGLQDLVGAGQGAEASAAHLAEVEALLVNAGTPIGQATTAARVVHAMQASIAAADPRVEHADLARAKHLASEFPWDALWKALGLDATRALYVQPEVSAAIARLLQQRSVEDWKSFLLYLEAREAAPFIEGASSPALLLQQMDQPRTAQQALGALYARGFDPQREAWSQTFLNHLQTTFLNDIAASVLGPADQAVLAAVFKAARLQLDAVDTAPWVPGVAGTRAYLHNIQTLQRAALAEELEAVRTPAASALPGEAAHQLRLHIDLRDGIIRLSPALLDAFWESAGRDDDDGRCGAIGAALGHELAHLLGVTALSTAGLSTSALSTQGKALFTQQEVAIKQRVDGRAVGSGILDGRLVAEEVAADLRGTSAARRACEIMAEGDGRSFQPAAFFQGAARNHATHPSARQLQAGLRDTHPPGPVRADLVAEVKGFEDAFGCDPAPRRPFDRII